MAAPPETTVATLSDFTALVASATTSAPYQLWYRGIGTTAHNLVPTLFRHPTKKDPAELLELEQELLVRFRHRSIPYQARPLHDAWELCFLMQHYGVPTRLLDWTENPFIALYFAITSAERRRSAGAFSADAAIWILRTGLWNGQVLSPYWKGRVVAVPDAPLDAYMPGAGLAKLAAHPVAMAGLHNSERIVAQRGAFTIFGHVNKSMETIYDEQQLPIGALEKVVLPKDSLSDLREALFGIGYADSMIYPDLEGLAAEIRRTFGFEG